MHSLFHSHSTHSRHGRKETHLPWLVEFAGNFSFGVQAVAVAVQTTHLLRLLTAVALIMVLRVAKSAMYSGKEIPSWQQALVHVYDLPPLVLLTLLQLSAIALPAKLYHDSPSTVPQKVHCVAVVVHWTCIFWNPNTASMPVDAWCRPLTCSTCAVLECNMVSAAVQVDCVQESCSLS